MNLMTCRLLLTDDNIEYYIVHYGGFVLDLTIGFWLLWSKSRPYAIFFGSSFHMMNSRLFAIGTLLSLRCSPRSLLTASDNSFRNVSLHVSVHNAPLL